MLKNLFLNTSAIRWAPKEDGTPTTAELEREQITVEELQSKKKEEEEDDKSNSDGEGDNKGDEENKEEAEEEVENEEEAKEETAEEKTIREAEEAASVENKSTRQVARMQKRIDTLTAKTRTTETENAELKRLLDAKKEDGSLTLTEEEVERRAELKANELDNERQFKKAVKTLATDANKLDKDFNKNIHDVTKEIGLLPPVMIAILEDLESEDGKKLGAEVLVHLSKNIDAYEDVYPLSEGRMALKLQAIANKINKKTPKPISQVPKPNEPIGGKGGLSPLNDKMSDDDWIKQREAETKGGIRKRA